MSSPPSPGSYPGNPSLPAEVREKILATFRHALNLFTSGNVSDCMIGCDFILKMDPRFTPARRLQEKVRNRDSDVDISEFQAIADPPPPGRPAAAPAPAAAEPRAEKPEPQRLLDEAAQRYETRDFDGAIAAATRALTLATDNKDALAMIEKASGRKAMQPLIEASRASMERSLDEERLPEAQLEFDRLRTADPVHPALPALERRLTAAASAPVPSPTDSGPRPQDAEEFALGGLQSEGYGSGPTLGDLSSEPAGLDPFFPHPSDLSSEASESAGPDAGNAGSFGPEETSPEADAPVPPSPSPDLFLPAEGALSLSMGSMPPPQTDEEEGRAAEREIDALLNQGDETARKGDRQQAIEIWSRVFLIDINNSGAVTRIEKARQEMAEESRLLADCLKRGRASFEAGDRDEARKFFLQAQILDPDEPTVRLYLERIEKGGAELAAPAAPLEAAGKPAVPAWTGGNSSETPAAAAAALPARGRRAALSINPRILAVIGAFLAMTLVGIYFVFKGPGAQAPTPKVVSSGSLQLARELLEKGKVQEARTELRRIEKADPDSEEARRLLAGLGRSDVPEAAGKGSRPAPPPGGSSSEARGDNDSVRLRTTAEKALSEKHYIEALKNFNLAAPAFRDDPNFSREQGIASDKVTALTPAVKFYNEGEYETAIPILWRIAQDDRDNQDARSYLLRSYYNQGIVQLQNGLYPKAIQAFREALALDPNDLEAARHKKFAERYQKGDLDLMGRIYVRHLSHRP